MFLGWSLSRLEHKEEVGKFGNELIRESCTDVLKDSFDDGSLLLEATGIVVVEEEYSWVAEFGVEDVASPSVVVEQIGECDVEIEGTMK